MLRYLWFLALVLALVIGGGRVFASEYKRVPGPFAVDTALGEWRDEAREGRVVPYKIYYARDVGGAAPVVIFSHGLGGSREGGAYLGEHLASYGYVAVHIQHPGTDSQIWDDGISLSAAREGAMDVESARNRFLDIPFVIDALEAMNAKGAFKGRFDLDHIGMSGHSYGAVSTMVAAGQKMGGLRLRSYAEERIDAAIAYSPSPAGGNLRAPNLDRLVRHYDDIRVPIFHMTGTEDGSPLRDMDPEERQLPFKTIDTVDQYLLVLDGGDHMVFNGERVRGPERDTDARHHDLIRMASIAFWDAELMDDAEARAWLDEGGFTQELGDDGTFEVKKAR